MIENETLKRRLEGVKELKSVYGISSQKALRYLKAIDDYDSLRAQVREDLQQAGIDYRPTVREISLLCTEFGNLIGDLLYNQSVKLSHSKKTAGSRGAYVKPYSKQISSERSDKNFISDFLGNMFKIDYRYILVQYFSTKTDYETMPKTMRKIFSQNNPFITTPDGRKLTFDQCTQDDILLNDDLSYDDTSGGQTEEESEIEERYEVIGKEFFETAVTEEESILLDRSLYDRAKNEHTLHRFETERRIALNLIMDFPIHTPEAVEELLNVGLERARERLVEAQKLFSNTPNILEKEARKDIERLRYKILAIRKNEQWLEEVLSR